MITKATLKRLERRLSPKLTEAEYQAAVDRHFARLDRVIDHVLAPLEACIAAIEAGTPIPDLDGSLAAFPFTPEDAKAWGRDQDLIDRFHKARWGHLDGKRLTAWGRTPEEMWTHYMRLTEEHVARFGLPDGVKPAPPPENGE